MSWKNPSDKEENRRKQQSMTDKEKNKAIQMLSKEEQIALASKQKEEKEKRIADKDAAYAAREAAKQADRARLFKMLIIERQQKAIMLRKLLERFRVLSQIVSSHSLEEIKKELIEIMKDRYQFFEDIINAVEGCFASPLTEGTSSFPIKHLNKAFYPTVEKLVQNPTTGNWETKRISNPDASKVPDDLVGIFYRRMCPVDPKTPVDTRVSNITEVTKRILSFLIKNSNKEFLKLNVTKVKYYLASTIVGKETDTIDFLERDQIDVSEYPKPIVIQDWMGARLLLWYILLKYEASTRTI
jgi:hypothetical protein